MPEVQKVVEEKELKEEVVQEAKQIEEAEIDHLPNWIPKTGMGKAIKRGKITSLEELWKMGKVIKEPEIIDYFVHDLQERVLKTGRGKRPFKWVQRMTDSGRRNKYSVMVAIGDNKSFVGLGLGRAKEYGGAIASALRNAKLDIVFVKKGCGSWDCGCGADHSIPVDSYGKSGSVTIILRPAPKGAGIIANNTTRDILELAGVKDVYSSTKGHTKTRSNLAKATFDALRSLSMIKQ
ncbi:TPA: 30S ribosomal protein S5 [archaeon]|nr:30S ribosomal protein S5 [Candidatus Naiadarchaeales archaeon SRR2090153.bin461]